jgi:hypothetical protein
MLENTALMKTANLASAVVFLLAACGDDGVPIDAGPDTGADGATDSSVDATDSAVDAGPCGMECTGDTPFCDEDAGMCVACLMDSDCTELDAPECDTTTGTCGACTGMDACTGRTGTEVCAMSGDSAGSCVECTETNVDACTMDHPCNPLTNACSAFEAMSAGPCEACDTDANCSVADSRCIALDFMGTAQGGRCLPLQDGGLCPTRPYTTVLSRPSLSDSTMVDVCGIREDLTTCEAVVAGNGGECTATMLATDCAPEGARCETLGGVPNQCTFACDSPLQCHSGFGCSGGICQPL